MQSIPQWSIPRHSIVGLFWLMPEGWQRQRIRELARTLSIETVSTVARRSYGEIAAIVESRPWREQARVLDRLERVKQTGSGRWVACCPAHQDRRPSLSIRELNDGRALIHCFAGCETEAVLSALNLTLGDLFERAIGDLPRAHTSIPVRDLLVILDHELIVVILILNDVIQRREVNQAQVQRLLQAASRVGKARDMANPATGGRRAT